MIFIVIEMFIVPINYPSRKLAMVGMGIIQAIYLGWIFCIKANANKWVYNVLDVLEWPQRIGFFVLSCSIPILLYFVGEFLCKLVWGSTMIKEQAGLKKKKAKSK